ncbi:hypothetical protein GCM10027413_10790 [Conyzicola nivalis]|uniref:Transmembrane protein n=1 Tax=Conyzicola nivalis TaxID=1477021 RepID=A0A916SIL4_9MICO|nr:hypothetical protein [Conyzicola nivalis]GGB02075.1 hypothetical protein GCM10010979_15840 [Conyzicola nivalis]
MTFDNAIGLIVGGVVFIAGIAIFIHAGPFVRVMSTLNRRIYGESRAARQFFHPVLVRVIAAGWVVLGFLWIVMAILGRFASGS